MFLSRGFIGPPLQQMPSPAVLLHGHPSQASLCEASVVVESRILGIDADGLVEVLDGPLVLAKVSVRDAPVVVEPRVLRVEVDGFAIFSYGVF